MSTVHNQQPVAFNLKLFEADSVAGDSDDGVRLTADATLSEVWRWHLKPQLEARGARPRNLNQYAESIKFWAQLTGDPPGSRITLDVTAGFARALQTLPGRDRTAKLSPNTVRKHCFHVQCVLDEFSPPSREHPNRLGLLPDVPYIERPKRRKKVARDTFRLDELERILAACKILEPPKRWQVTGITPTQMMQAMMIFDYNVGLRIGTLFDCCYSWIHADDDFQCLVLEVPGEYYKGGDPHLFPLNAAACQAIEAIRTPDRDRIFAWPFALGRLQALRRDILAAAEIPPNRRFGFHGIRKLHGTKMAKINPLAGQLSLGHTNSKTFMESYTAPTFVAEALGELPQPKLS